MDFELSSPMVSSSIFIDCIYTDVFIDYHEVDFDLFCRVIILWNGSRIFESESFLI